MPVLSGSTKFKNLLRAAGQPGAQSEEEDALPTLLRAPLSALAWLGRTLDWPTRTFIREPFTGKKDASGRDVLETLGILKANTPGLDAGDVAGFAAEVALDPLTYLTGGLTKGGKALSQAASRSKQLKAVRSLGLPNEEAVDIAQKLLKARKTAREEGVGRKLAEGWGAQVRAGQRAPLKFMGVPILPKFAGAPLAGGVEATGKWIGGTRPAQLISKLFRTQHGKPAASLEHFEAAGRMRRGGAEEVSQWIKEARPEWQRLVSESGVPAADYERAFTQGLESLMDLNPEKIKALRENPELWARNVQLARAMPKESMPLAKKLIGLYGRMGAKEVDVGARAEKGLLQSASIGYFPRKKAEGAVEFLKKEGEEKLPFYRERSLQGSSDIARVEPLRELTTADANAEMAKITGTNKPWFELNPIRATATRYREHVDKIAAAKLQRALLDDLAVPHVPGQTMSAFEFIDRGKLYINKDLYPGKGIPKDVANEFLKVRQKVFQPEEIKTLMRMWDKASGWWRFGLTTPWPAFHFRNLISDTALSFIGGGLSLNPKLWYRAFKLSKDPKWVAKGQEIGFLRGSKTGDLISQIAPEGEKGAVEKFIGKHPSAEWLREKANRYYAQRVENFTRTLHFLSKKAKGLTDIEAAREVRKWLLDYSDLTDFEKKLRSATLFYNWTRKVTPLLVRSYFESTPRMAALTRATTLPSEQRPDIPLPEWFRQSAAIPAGVDAQGNPRFITGTGSPLEELNKLDLSSPVRGPLGELARKLTIQLNPMIRTPIEAAFGREAFFDRPILASDKAPALLDKIPGLKQFFGVRKEELPGGKTRFHGDPYKLFALRATPLSRAVQTASQIGDVVGNVDPRKSTAQSLLQLLTGARIQSLDPIDKLRSEIEALKYQQTDLMRQGKLGEIPIPFAREIEGKKAPEAEAFLRQNRLLRKLLKQTREAPTNAPP